jgi:hypothetical protein
LAPRTRKRKNPRRDPKAATAIDLEEIHAVRINAANSHAVAISSVESAAESLLTRINDVTSRIRTKAADPSLTTRTLTSKIGQLRLTSWNSKIPDRIRSKILNKKHSDGQPTGVHGIQISASVALDRNRLKQLRMRQLLVNNLLQRLK